MEDDSTGHGGPTGQGEQRPDSLLPYDDWTEAALRQVLVRALQHAAVHGLPGEHHFYLTFRTDHPGVSLPVRLKAQYPQEMTIVLQHQFWDLAVDEAQEAMRSACRSAACPAPCASRSPLSPPSPTRMCATACTSASTSPNRRRSPNRSKNRAGEPAAEPAPAEAPQVVSLDAFRRRTPPKES